MIFVHSEIVFNQQILPSWQVAPLLRAFIDPAIVLSMFMLSFIFVIKCGLFVSGSESVQVVFIVCLFMYCCWRSNY